MESVGLRKTHKKQRFKTFDLLALIIGLVGLAILTSVLIDGHQTQKQNSLAQFQLNELVLNVLRDKSWKGTSQPSSRGVASKTQLDESSLENPNSLSLEKLDPWGHPYQLVWVRDVYGEITHFIIYTLGKNQRLDSSNVSKVTSQSVPSARVFQGDDLGLIQKAD